MVYPYEKAISWLSRQEGIKRLFFLGYDYSYHGGRFYFKKYNFAPEGYEIFFSAKYPGKIGEILQLSDFFHDYERLAADKTDSGLKSWNEYPSLPADTILYHSINGLDLNENALYGGAFKIVKKFTNSENNKLYIFRKI
jgi:hypothetical protein